MVAGGGFEPPKASLADLQSAPFGRSGIQPHKIFVSQGIGTGAGNGSRTRISSLEGWCTAVMPYPQKIQRSSSVYDTLIIHGTDGGSRTLIPRGTRT